MSKATQLIQYFRMHVTEKSDDEIIIEQMAEGIAENSELMEYFLTKLFLAEKAFSQADSPPYDPSIKLSKIINKSLGDAGLMLEKGD